VNWEDNLVLARGLARQPFEVTERAAVGRAYYGAFNLARRRLEAQGTPIDNWRAHRQVWQAFKTAERAAPDRRRDWELIGRLADSLHQFRNQVDYDDRVEDLKARTERALASAERIVQILAALEVGPGRR
jgi:uncharacterized protein (UPF0332 family)